MRPSERRPDQLRSLRFTRGFTAHAELSLAYDLHPSAIRTGQQVFGFL